MTKSGKNKKSEEELRQELMDDLLVGRLTPQQAARRMRKIVGLSQADYAKQLGIAERTYIDFERGVGNPTLDTLNKIGGPFGVKMVYYPA